MEWRLMLCFGVVLARFLCCVVFSVLRIAETAVVAAEEGCLFVSCAVIGGAALRERVMGRQGGNG